MYRLFILAMVCTSAAHAELEGEACVQDVLISLYGQLEAIDVAGEAKLILAIDQLAAQEGWTDSQKSEFTLSIADSPAVEKAESERTEILAEMFGLAQKDRTNCSEITALRDRALDIERVQWRQAVDDVQRRLWH